MDSDNTGTLTPKELLECLKQVDHNMTEEQVSEIFNKVDQNDDGYVNYTEFIVACTASNLFDDHQNINKTLKRRDTFDHKAGV